MANNSHYMAIFGNLSFMVLNALVIVILFYVAKKSFEYGKRAFICWILISMSQLVTILGNIIFSTMYTGSNQLPFPSIADIFYLAYYPLIIIGILYLPINQTPDAKKYQILLDTGILITSAGLVLWVLLISLFPDINILSMITSLFYLLLDIFLLFLISYLMLDWFGQVKKVPLFLLAASVIALAVTNIIFIYQFLYELYIPGGVLDMGWLVSYILTALAGISYIDEKIRPSPRFQYRQFLSPKFNWSSYLTALWLVFIYILLFWIYTQLTDINLDILVWGAAVIMTMMFIRQIWALKESDGARKLLQNNQKILEKRETHLSLITDNMMDLITRSNADGEYEYVSPSARKILGYMPKDMLGKNILDFVHPDDLKNVKSSIKKAAYTPSLDETEYLSEVEYRHKTSSGDYIWIETAGTPIFDHEKGLTGFVCSSRNIDDRKHAEKQIKTSLEEKEVLLKEIHHRVKNNMQIISSLLSLQSGYIKDENYLAIFKESQNRVRSMAMIHESLYRTQNLARINFGKYIQNLISGLFSSYGIEEGIIKTKMDLNYVLLDIDIAIPCGLILNELITNSLKHAFPAASGRGPTDKKSVDPVNESHGAANRRFASSSNSTFTPFTTYSHESLNTPLTNQEEMDKEINVSLSQNGNKLKIIVGDNGRGFPENIDFRNTESLGLQLINTLVDQLEGEIELERDNGTRFILNLENKTVN